MEKHRVFLSIGTNTEDKQNNIKECLVLLEKSFINIVKVSPIYKTVSWGFEGNDFLNLAVEINTSLQPEHLLQEILRVEKEMGRDRTYDSDGYQDRIIDIDILFYDDLIEDSKNLTIPHPHIQDRNFVLGPLNDIVPKFVHPVYKKDIKSLYKACSDPLAVQKL